MDNNDKVLIALLSGGISLIISVLTIIFGFKKIQKERIEDFKSKHYDKIIDSYLIFWNLQKFLSIEICEEYSIFVKNENNTWNISKKNFLVFSTELIKFFYSQHGIYLSRQLRKLVFEFKRELEILTKESDYPEISNNKFKSLKYKVHSIIVQIRCDIGLRDTYIPTKKLKLVDKLKTRQDEYKT